MRFRELPLACECGLPPVRLKSVGFTSEYELVIHWRCIFCGKLMYLVKSLADCVRECPEADDAGQLALAGSLMSSPADDAGFLRRMGIRFPEDGD